MRRAIRVGIVGFLLAGGVRADQPYVVLPDGRRVTGVSVTVDDKGQILLNTGKATVTYPEDTRVVVDRPPELDQAIQLMQSKQTIKAAAVLKTLVTKYRGLGWDRDALQLLARAYATAARHADAVEVYEQLFEVSPASRENNEDYLRYLKALEAGQQGAKLAGLLDATIATGPRAAAAWAQLARGNRAFEAGDVKAALLDFKRTADFFRDQEETMPEALYRTAVCLDALMEESATDYVERLKQEFPGSPFAARPLR